MKIEYEATFPNIDKDKIRERLKKAGAVLVRPEFLQKRVVFNLPEGHEIKGGWLRVRDEQDKVTMSLKIVTNGGIDNQKEICLTVDNFENAEDFLNSIGCRHEGDGYQESKREIWILDEVEICIDEWPFLEPFIEIEGDSESVVQGVSEKLGFNYAKALFCAVDTLYANKYGIDTQFVNKELAAVTFEGKNPFENL
jgi:adenylate cyclase, class 2